MSGLDDLRFLEQRFSGVMALLKDLEKVESLQNHIKELLGKRDWIQKEVDRLRSEFSGAEQAAEQVVSEAETKAIELKAEADRVLEKAKAQADAIVDVAGKEAQAVVTTASDRAIALEDSIASRRTILTSLDSEISQKQASLEELNSALAKLKAKL